MGYRCFCKQALELSPSEILKFDANELPLEALKRLSSGTGISIRQLNIMKYHNVWKRLKKALEKAIESDGIKAPRPIIID